jgi:hypothetical protein
VDVWVDVERVGWGWKRKMVIQVYFCRPEQTTISLPTLRRRQT